jgi:transcriptional regulator with XRE-family HTH domain
VKPNRYNAYLKELGKNIRSIRKQKGMSMEALSYAAEIEYRLVGRIERGEGNTTVVSLLKIADALNVDVFDFFDFSINSKKN